MRDGMGADSHPPAPVKKPQLVTGHGPIFFSSCFIRLHPSAELHQPFFPSDRVDLHHKRMKLPVERSAAGRGECRPATPETAVVQGKALRESPGSHNDPLEFIPPVLAHGVKVSGADKKSGRYPHFFQDGQGF